MERFFAINQVKAVMIKSLKFIILIILAVGAKANAASTDYIYKIDLTRVKDDKLQVSLQTPKCDQDEVRFCFPAMVPGTYEVYNFGRFVSNLKAYDKSDKELPVKKINDNIYSISSAKELAKINYEVEDTWDTQLKEKVVFEPGGTNIEDKKNFSINTHGFFGYFDGMLGNKFVLEFTKPSGFYPATGLTNVSIGNEKDVLTVNGYHELVDSPIMYSIPDTTVVQVANTKVLVACYSPNKKVSSHFIANTISEMLYAQRDYLGGVLPVEKYAFLFYFTDKPTLSGSHGALEHSASSFYVMPEMDSMYIEQEVRDVAAHEFFHIVTPLNIHSKEIGDFDFINPKMSEHLWLYEGMTEYAAHHAQVRAGLIGIDEFINVMMGKYETSINAYNDTMSFTFMSKNVLTEKIHTQYGNVYEKGALIGMCLDIYLRHLSEGKYGTQNLMKDLSKKYGKTVSFEDHTLFEEIEKLTYPEIGVFFKKHVAGKEPLPIKEVFEMVGLKYYKEKMVKNFSLGNFDVGFNEETQRLIVSDISDLDDFGREMKYQVGDELISINGTELKSENIQAVFTNYFTTVKEGDIVKVVVARTKGKKGKLKQVELSAKAKLVEQKQYNMIDVYETLTDKQSATIKGWLGFSLN
ncbi:MAG: peptidase M61 [Bacteroidia bacterium]